MRRITTESGAVYLVDNEVGRVQRVTGEMNPGLILDNGVWEHMTPDEDIEVGKPMHLTGFTVWRRTTPVVSIEEVV